MAGLCDGEIVLYGHDGDSPAIGAHLDAGRRAVYVRGRNLVLAAGAARTVLAGLPDLVEPGALMPAAAAAWAMGFEPDAIRTGLESYRSDGAVLTTAGGRMPQPALT
jgi:cyanophycin synthetase